MLELVYTYKNALQNRITNTYAINNLTNTWPLLCKGDGVDSTLKDQLAYVTDVIIEFTRHPDTDNLFIDNIGVLYTGGKELWGDSGVLKHLGNLLGFPVQYGDIRLSSKNSLYLYSAKLIEVSSTDYEFGEIA